MFITHQTSSQRPLILIHGGAGDYSERQELLNTRRQHIIDIINNVWPRLLNGESGSPFCLPGS